MNDLTIPVKLQLTQAELAKRLQITLPSVSRYESGKSLSNPATLRALYNLAEQLGDLRGVHMLGRELASRMGSGTVDFRNPLLPERTDKEA